MGAAFAPAIQNWLELALIVRPSKREDGGIAQHPFNNFMEVRSISNEGGGYGLALSACPSSLHALLTVHVGLLDCPPSINLPCVRFQPY